MLSKELIFNIKVSDIIGIIGVTTVLLAYLLLNLKKINLDDYKYSLINFLGALLIIVSLLVDFNLASFIIEIVWVAISLYGIIRCLKH